MKKSNGELIKWTSFVVLFSSLYTVDAFALNVNDLGGVSNMVTFLKDTVIQNLAYVAVFAAFIIGAIAAVGNKIGPVIVDNIGKVMFFAFGGTALTYFLGAAGATLV